MPRAHTKELAELATRLYATGKSSVEVASELAVSKAWVLRKLRVAGIVRPLREALKISNRRFASGSQCHSWRGGVRMHSDGYRELLRPDHPYAQKTGYVLEHRIVMEQTLGRYLLPGEDVHHKNGIRTDNSPGNLEVIKHGSHMSLHALTRERHKEGHFGTEARKPRG